MKDPIVSGFRSSVVYKFSSAICEACYVSETTRHFSAHAREHLTPDKNSHIGKYLQKSNSPITLVNAVLKVSSFDPKKNEAKYFCPH